MAEIANTAWYRQGAVSVTNKSTIVTGIGTNWITAGINPGATFRIDNSMYAHEVKSVISDTEIELAKPYNGLTASGVTYSIDRNFQSTSNAKLSADVTAMVRLYENVRDGTMSTIEGRSAYQVAVANGFSGTEAQWLESLKVTSDDYATLAAAIEPFTVHNAYSHNSIARQKNLGSEITAAQLSAIRSHTWKDLYIGDYWVLPTSIGNIVARIVGFSRYITPGDCMILWFEAEHHANINDTDTCEGGLYNSKMFQEHLPAYLDVIREVIPDEYIKSTTAWPIADAINANGFVNHFMYNVEQKIFLPTAKNLGMSDTFDRRCEQNNPYGQLGNVRWPIADVFCPAHLYCWYASNYNATQWCCTGYFGNIEHGNASTITNLSPYIFLG